MRKFVVALLLVSWNLAIPTAWSDDKQTLAAADPAAHTQQPVRVIGEDWLLMSQAEKAAYLSSALDFLQKHGVPLSKSPDQYLAAVNQLSDNPKMLSVDATNILASYVYETEPASRQILETLLKKPAAGPKS